MRRKIISILLCIAMIVTLTPCTLLADTLTVTSFTTEVTNTPANGKYFDVGETVQITMTLIAGTKYSDVYGYDNLMGSTSVLYIDKTNSGNDSKLPIIRMSLLQLTHITAIREEAKRTDLTV